MCNINGERIVYRKLYAGLSEEIEMRLDNEANQRRRSNFYKK
jgi:hypothetical protein